MVSSMAFLLPSLIFTHTVENIQIKVFQKLGHENALFDGIHPYSFSYAFEKKSKEIASLKCKNQIREKIDVVEN